MITAYVFLLTVAAAAVFAQPAWAQEFPARPIRMLVAFAPGGNTDILARAVGVRRTESWGKPVVVDKLNAGIGRILRGTDAREYLIGTGVEVTPRSQGELARFVKSETDKYRRIIQASGTRLDRAQEKPT